MSIPTVAVTCIAYDQNGNPVIGGLFRARLNRTETYNGFVVPEQVTGIADANGVCILQLWPNALGVASSSYRINAINPDTGQQYLNTTAVVPNSACNLHEIIVAAPFPPVSASEQALTAAQGALASVTAQAGIATAAADDAEDFADDAEDSAVAAQASAVNASASFTDLDKRYLGTKSSDPTVDNEGNALDIGAIYYLDDVGLRIYNGNIWSAAYISESGTLTNSDIGVTVQAQSANLNDFAAKTAPAGVIVGTTDTQALTNKSISGSANTLTNIANASLVNQSVTVNGQTVALGASTTVTATATNPLTIGTGLNGSSYNGSAPVTVSLANTAVTPGAYGSASSTLTATANAQGQLTALAATAIAIANTQVSGLGTASVLDAAVALGTATLDAGGKVPLSQIPASIQGGVSYQGSWDAATNTPTIVSSVGDKGYYYVVSVGGTTTIDGISDWLPSDWIIFNGTAWEKIDNTDSVTSVNGYIGAVSLNAADVGAPPTTRTITAGTGLTGGGDLSANRTFDISNTAVTAGSYGSASQSLAATVNAQGQLTAASNTTIAIANTQVSGLGTMSTQNANNVAVTGGTIDGATVGSTTAAAGAFTTLTATSATLNGTTVPASKTLVTTDDTQTLTNKTLTSPAITTPTGIVKGDVGLSNVDNTSDANKNSATATLTNKTINLTSNTLVATSAQIAAAVTDETGTGALVFATSPTLVTPALGTPASGVVTNLTGTASININGTVGATTASTGAFTTLNTSGQVVFNEAGANVDFRVEGDTEPNLLFVDASADNVGIGTNAPLVSLHVAAATTPQIFMESKGEATDQKIWGFQYGTGVGAGTFRLRAVDDGFITGQNAYIITRTGFSVNTHQWLTAGTERMRIDSAGNVGIGTSSPINKLTVGNPSGLAGQAPTTASFHGTSSINSSIATVGLFSTEAAGVGVGPILTFGGSSGNSVSPYPFAFIQGCKASATAGDYSGFLRFWTVPSDGSGPVERLHLDSSGNLGLGVTPTGTSGLGSNRTLEIGGTSVPSLVLRPSGSTSEHTFGGAGDGMLISAAGAATASNNAIRFFTSNTNSSTALSERARITSGGDFCVGSTSVPSAVANFRSLVVGGVTGGIVDMGTTSTSYGRVSADSVGLNLESLGATTTIFRTNGSERARITSGGDVGIGTSSPGAKLHVYNTASADVGLLESTQVFSTLAFKSSTNSSTATIGIDGAGNASLENKLAGSNITFVTKTSGGSSSAAMRIDSAGNLLVGGTTYQEVGSFSAKGTGEFAAVLTSGAGGEYLIGAIGGVSNGYQISVDASNNQTYRWFIGGSPAMTLDASGQLIVGGTTAHSTVTINGNFGEYFVANIDSATINASNKVGFRLFELGTAIGELSYARDGSGKVVLGSLDSSSLAFITNNTERMRIDSSGNVGIGTSSPDARLHVAGEQLIQPTTAANAKLSMRHGSVASNNFFEVDISSNTIFGTNNAERARITSAGYLKASDTGTYVDPTGAFHEFNQSTDNANLIVDSTNASLTGTLVFAAATRNTTNNSFFYFMAFNRTASAIKFQVADSGNVTNTNNSYGSISDVKLKENVTDVASKLDKLAQVRVVNYNLKTNPDQKLLGVIAQELEQIFPGMVEETTDRDAEGNDLGTTTKAVKYSVFVPMLIKGLQELKAINDAQAQTIESLKARLDAANL